MQRSVVALVVVLLVHVRSSDASCAYMAPQSVKLVVETCTAVDTSKIKSPATPKSYEGLLIEGMLTAGKAKPVKTKVWVPASEKLSCTQIKPKAAVTGTASYSCCDGDTNPPCWIQTSTILTKLKIAVAPAKRP